MRLLFCIFILLCAGLALLIFLNTKKSSSSLQPTYTLSPLEYKNEIIKDMPWGPTGRVIFRKLVVTDYRENKKRASIKLNFLKSGKTGAISIQALETYSLDNDNYLIGSTTSPPIKIGNVVDIIVYYLPEIPPLNVDKIKESVVQSPTSDAILNSLAEFKDKLSSNAVDKLLSTDSIILPNSKFYLLGLNVRK